MKKKALAILLTAAVLAVSGCTESGAAAGNENAETVTEQVAAAFREKPEPVVYEFDNGDTAYFYFDDEPVPGCCSFDEVLYGADYGDTAYFYFDDEPVPGCCG